MRQRHWAGRSLTFLLSIISVGLGLLSLRPAPSELLLKVKVVSTEYGYVIAALQALALVSTRSFRSGAGRIFNLLMTATTIAGSLLAAGPLVRAMLYARDLPQRLDSAFGGQHQDQSSRRVFAFSRLFRFWSTPLKVTETLVFSATEEYELRLDLFRPPVPAPGGSPCIVVVHGGSWIRGDSRDFASLSPYLSRQGYVVVGVNYRKADKYPFPAARDDLRASIAYIKDNASYLGVDADRIALLGRSAGGQLALLVAYEEDDPAIRGVVSFYAPTDMVYGFNNPTDTRVIDTPATLDTYLRGTPATSREHYDAASPINFVGENSPPTLLLHGSQDEMVHPAQSDRLSQQLAKFGVDHLYLKLPWATHGFDHNLWGPGGQISTYSVERFMHSLLRK